MWKKIFPTALGLLLGLSSLGARAHHGGGGASSGLAMATISQRLQQPRSNIYFNFEFSHLDDGVGELFLYQLQGEYALKPYLSLGARLPFWSVREDFLPSSDKLGDVALTLKSQAWQSARGEARLLAGLDSSFPTGDKERSRGAGAVVLSPFVSYTHDWRPISAFAALSSSYELSSSVNPTLSYELGVLIPLVRGKLPLKALVSYQGLSFLASDTFRNGSSKGWISSGLLLQFSERWDASLVGKFSVLDTLKFHPDVKATDFATGLLSDVQAGIGVSVGYQF